MDDSKNDNMPAAFKQTNEEEKSAEPKSSTFNNSLVQSETGETEDEDAEADDETSEHHSEPETPMGESEDEEESILYLFAIICSSAYASKFRGNYVARQMDEEYGWIDHHEFMVRKLCSQECLGEPLRPLALCRRKHIHSLNL